MRLAATDLGGSSAQYAIQLSVSRNGQASILPPPSFNSTCSTHGGTVFIGGDKGDKRNNGKFKDENIGEVIGKGRGRGRGRGKGRGKGKGSQAAAVKMELYARSIPGGGLIESMETIMSATITEDEDDSSNQDNSNSNNDSNNNSNNDSNSNNNSNRNPCVPKDGVQFEDGSSTVDGSGDFDACVRLVEKELLPLMQASLDPSCVRADDVRPDFVVGLDNFPKVCDIRGFICSCSCLECYSSMLCCCHIPYLEMH